jgi:hypothetical protein
MIAKNYREELKTSSKHEDTEGTGVHKKKGERAFDVLTPELGLAHAAKQRSHVLRKSFIEPARQPFL